MPDSRETPPAVPRMLVPAHLAGTPDSSTPNSDVERRDVETVSHPSKLVRLATMARALLVEANAIEMDESARERLANVFNRTADVISELLSEDLRAELETLGFRFSENGVPTTSELRIAQAQLVGWLEGLFHGIRTTLMTQHLATQEQLAELYSHALREAQQQQDRDALGHYL